MLKTQRGWFKSGAAAALPTSSGVEKYGWSPSKSIAGQRVQMMIHIPKNLSLHMSLTCVAPLKLEKKFEELYISAEWPDIKTLSADNFRTV